MEITARQIENIMCMIEDQPALADHFHPRCLATIRHHYLIHQLEGMQLKPHEWLRPEEEAVINTMLAQIQKGNRPLVTVPPAQEPRIIYTDGTKSDTRQDPVTGAWITVPAGQQHPFESSCGKTEGAGHAEAHEETPAAS